MKTAYHKIEHCKAKICFYKAQYEISFVLLFSSLHTVTESAIHAFFQIRHYCGLGLFEFAIVVYMCIVQMCNVYVLAGNILSTTCISAVYQIDKPWEIA